MAKKRVDVVLVERGLFESRNKAAAAVMAGEVSFAADGRRIDKPGQAIDDQAELLVANQDGFVSRGGLKLANALAS
ncbi:MAG: TlyA family rRNA (cytidine-2'-O)-methyltransferase, partial [Thermoleophilaceae bacterium]|nr:TlyA family rRNA (cytidine-2'-O)-methyltransferase [Thermoleophilaceae bacterium]